MKAKEKFINRVEREPERHFTARPGHAKNGKRSYGILDEHHREQLFRQPWTGMVSTNDE